MGSEQLPLTVAAKLPLAARLMLPICLLGLVGNAAAFQVAEFEAPDAEDKPLWLRVWTPDDFDSRVAVASNRFPVVVISHGTGATLRSHEDSAEILAGAGFVVASVLHTGDNYKDQSYVRLGQHLSGRPRHVIRAMDFMLARWQSHSRLDPDRVGLFGFSAGGFTTLVLAGGAPDLSRGIKHCRERPTAWDCQYLRKNGIDVGRLAGPPPNAWLHDRRIRAAVVAAPAVAYAFEPDGLRGVTIPIQLWVGGRDEIVGADARSVADLLPNRPELHEEVGAGHFSFLAPCGLGLKAMISVLQMLDLVEDVCADPEGFDRLAFKASFNSSVVQFFKKHLQETAAPSPIG